MADGAHVPLGPRLRLRWNARPLGTRWFPSWSKAAALRAIRAAIVIPTLFALCDQVIGNLQMATFAAFGGFATLVLAGFAGTRRDKLIAHSALALAGTVLIVIGTAVNASVALAVVVTLPVTFLVFFAGVAGPNAASGATAALLAYVLPAASPGALSMIPDRLAGWWLASIAGTAAVLALSPPAGASRLRGAAEAMCAALADGVDAALAGAAVEAAVAACLDAKHELLAAFTATPLRPTGLATPDQALANAVELLEWCTSLLVDSLRERSDLRGAAAVDRALLAETAAVLRDTSSLFAGRSTRPDLDALEACRAQSISRLRQLSPDSKAFRTEAQLSFHAHALTVTVLAVGADALVSSRLADEAWMSSARLRWFAQEELARGDGGRLASAARYAGVAARHASVRSVWFINSVRGAVALAVAVAVADLSSVQHAFWVVLGTLSVLRTNAASTGSTALRAMIGTVIGFAIGGALLLAIGSSSTALWVVLPIAVAVAAYAPGVAPFAVGQAAFTVTVAVLFNLLVPVGWKVGALRVEDVAIGCAVSVAVGSLFWPHGVAAVVGDDLADAYRAGAAYLSQALRAVSGSRAGEPGLATSAVTAGSRLDEALRGFLAEQGTKHIPKEELWRLVGGTLRLRLTAHAIAGQPRITQDVAGAGSELGRRADLLAAWYEQLAAQLGRPQGQAAVALTAPTFDSGDLERASPSHQAVWLSEHLDHLTEHLNELVPPAIHLAEVRRRPWWR